MSESAARADAIPLLPNLDAPASRGSSRAASVLALVNRGHVAVARAGAASPYPKIGYRGWGQCEGV
jgi:hypothetical protein